MKNLIFIAKGCPNKIKSAGDIRALRMLQILRNEYGIDVIANSADYGINDVKNIGCTPHLTGNFKNTITEILGAKQIDGFIISHWRIAQQIIDFIRTKSNVPIIIDTIDVEFLRLEREHQYKNDFDQVKSNIELIKNLELDIYKKADYIVATTEFDKEELLKYDSHYRACILPCIFDINKTSANLGTNNAYTICNWSHEPNITSTVYLCEKVIPNVEINFYVIGKHPPEQVRRFHQHNRINVCGAEYKINEFLSRVSMCLAPIFYGAGMNGKIGESASFGIPVITTPMGAKPWGMIHKETAMICETDKEFIDSINELLSNEKLRNKLSINGKELMQNFSVDYWKSKLLEVMKQWI